MMNTYRCPSCGATTEFPLVECALCGRWVPDAEIGDMGGFVTTVLAVCLVVALVCIIAA